MSSIEYDKYVIIKQNDVHYKCCRLSQFWEFLLKKNYLSVCLSIVMSETYTYTSHLECFMFYLNKNIGLLTQLY